MAAADLVATNLEHLTDQDSIALFTAFLAGDCSSELRRIIDRRVEAGMEQAREADAANTEQRMADLRAEMARQIAAAERHLPESHRRRRNSIAADLDLADQRQAELEAYRTEDLRVRQWAAACRESDVRCDGCNLRYGERDQYGCSEHDHTAAHHYDEGDLAAARALDDPTIPRADDAPDTTNG